MNEKRWIIIPRQRMGNIEGIPWRLVLNSYGIFSLRDLDRHLKWFVPALFSKIEIVNNKITVEVPFQVVSRLVKHLRDHCCIDIPVKVTGV